MADETSASRRTVCPPFRRSAVTSHHRDCAGRPQHIAKAGEKLAPQRGILIRARVLIKHIGKLFGVVQVDGYEVATYRSDTYNGKQLTVGTVSTLWEDCVRRDFTINALGMDLNGIIYDFTGGEYDLRHKIIRANGDPLIRFTEDPSRILRGIYLEIKLGFTIEEKTLEVMRNNSQLIKEIEPNVIGRILEKVFKHHLFGKFIQKLIDYDLLKMVFGIESTVDTFLLQSNLSQIISYALLYSNETDFNLIGTILQSYLITKKDVNFVVMILKFSNVILNDSSAIIPTEILKEVKGKPVLDKLISDMMIYYQIINPNVDLNSFFSTYQNKIYFQSGVLMNGLQLMELGITGRRITEVFNLMIQANCKTIRDCHEVLESINITIP